MPDAVIMVVKVIVGVVCIAVPVILLASHLLRNADHRFVGYLVIGEDPEEESPYIFLEFKIKPEDLMNNEELVIKVKRKNIL